MGTYKMIEPWGYQEENDYVSKKSQLYQELQKNRENDEEEFASIDKLFDKTFTDVRYNKDSESLVFYNDASDAKVSVPMTDIIPSDLVKSAEYDKVSKKIIITFDNDDKIEIPVDDLIDTAEAGDGLKLDTVEGVEVFSVLVDSNTEKSYVDNTPYLSVSSEGVKVSGINLAVETETERAEAVEETLDSKIDAETSRATEQESQLNSLISAEKTRAQEAEEAEANRAKEAEQALDSRCNTLDEKIDNEATRAQAVEETLRLSISSEESRATQAENLISSNLQDEVTRATAKENEIETALSDEVSNRESGDAALDEKINAEKDARTNGDIALETAITNEISNRESADSNLETKISNEETARKDGSVASVSYVKADAKIYFKNANDTVISEIDASDFVKDAMVENVEVVDVEGVKYLRVTFNTDGESKVIDVSLADIFDPSLYYTKGESDAKYATKAEVEAVDAKVEAIDLTPYATMTWVEEQNYLTEHQDISNLATKAEVEAVDAKVDAIDLTPYATKAEVEAVDAKVEAIDLTPYATKVEVEAVDAKVDAIDLTPYATKAEVEGELLLKADKTEIPTDFYSQEEVNAMMSQLLTRIENVEDKSGVVVASSVSDITDAAVGSNLVVTSSDALAAMTANKEYNTVTVVGSSINSDMKAIASDKVTVDGLSVNGGKGASNGKMQLSADTVTLKNVTIETGATAYNIFESSQNTAKSEYFTETYTAENVTCDNTALNHNIFNIYTFKDNAVVTIKDSYFNLDADASNVLRLSNYTNAENVTVVFENVDWTYENAEVSDWKWAGLVIYQPAGSDVALNGDTSKLATWTFKFKNCKYNGELVNAVNFGEHSQVVYGYNMNKSGNVSDISSISTFVFE